MFRTLVSFVALVLAVSGAKVVSSEMTFRSALHDYRVVTVVKPTPILGMEPVERAPVN
jgi:hypothetical protein